ncbi:MULTISPECIES: PE-PPE domain-containing protein [Mycolicibacter]|uniref:PE-PPE domain-containing protein n=2 Tax=Mycolicibacter TaxID=1073531 RepID=A0ABU5XMI4_9MYCO|nr:MULTISPECIES: PE-PPE domain-containing protein [unclassified Mycolicibacter]MEB3023482.1 PE-PPE domain-containing protein [Mycolicibacter sp. MYC098]MEB3035097.1 PE-PPE domain-containing protein [Mycolicibacter sp. MYC340]
MAFNLSSAALVMGPSGWPNPTDIYLDVVERLYLSPLGFEGTTHSLYTPSALGPTDPNLADDVRYILKAVYEQIAAGTVSAESPLWLFGYSQSAAAASMAAIELEAAGVPSEYLHFVLVGNSASAHGGFLNMFLDSMPALWKQFLVANSDLLAFTNSAGLTTPEFFPTDVFTITNDGFANWPASILDFDALLSALYGMAVSHNLYLGLSPHNIPDVAVPDHVQGLANYYSIALEGINVWEALVTSAVAVGLIPEWLGDLIA